MPWQEVTLRLRRTREQTGEHPPPRPPRRQRSRPRGREKRVSTLRRGACPGKGSGQNRRGKMEAAGPRRAGGCSCGLGSDLPRGGTYRRPFRTTVSGQAGGRRRRPGGAGLEAVRSLPQGSEGRGGAGQQRGVTASERSVRCVPRLLLVGTSVSQGFTEKRQARGQLQYFVCLRPWTAGDRTELFSLMRKTKGNGTFWVVFESWKIDAEWVCREKRESLRIL